MAELPNRKSVDDVVNRDAAALEVLMAESLRQSRLPPSEISEQPAAYSDKSGVAHDTALALGELQAWIERAPSERMVTRIAKIGPCWFVAVCAAGEELTASKDAELRGAIRSALMIANFAGHK